MNKIITIVIPTYNMEKYLDKCLTSLIIDNPSLMSQVEVLVVIDGAKDRSSEIAHSYQDRYPETFKVIDKENGNYGSCVNRGLAEATGKYIKVLDADDYFDSKVFEDYIKYLKEVDVDMVISDFNIVDENGNITSTKVYALGQQGVIMPFDISLGELFYKKNLQMHGVTYKTQNLRDLNYRQTEGISYTDQEWTYTPLYNVKTIAYYKGLLYQYLVGRAGQTMDPSVFIKSLPQNERCVLRKFTDYMTLQPATEGCKYFAEKWMKFNVINSYRHYIFNQFNLSNEHLKEFDDKMCAVCDNAQKFIDDLTLLHTNFHFIAKWRTNDRKPYSTIKSKLAFFQTRLLSKIF